MTREEQVLIARMYEARAFAALDRGDNAEFDRVMAEFDEKQASWPKTEIKDADYGAIKSDYTGLPLEDKRELLNMLRRRKYSEGIRNVWAKVE